jgi:hypothetical protein
MTRRFIVILSYISVPRSVARIRLVETGNHSACSMVNRKMCKSAIALY